MVNSAARYRRAIKKKLPCGGDTRELLMNRFQAMLDSYMEEHPDPAEEDLYTAFGSPESMALVLSEGIPEEAVRRHKTGIRLKRIAAGALAAALLLFAGYVFFYKEIPVDFVDEAYIYPIAMSSADLVP